MAKKPTIHSYADLSSFERLMLLIATLVQFPGIGSADPEADPAHLESSGETAIDRAPAHDALKQVQDYLQQVAQQQGLTLRDYSIHTLRKDLATLRRYGILDRRMYRWGYYLGTGAMSRDELRTAFQALGSQAKMQGDARSRQMYERLSRRLKGLNLELEGELFYPVRQQLNRVIVQTDPDEMMRSGKHQDTLFHQIEQLETAILSGQAIELSRSHDPYGAGQIGMITVYPLQLVYYDIAWYLVTEDCASGHLAIQRLNRFKNYLKPLHPQGRGIVAQQASLARVHQLLENGWGLFLGQPQEQQAELRSELPFVLVKVRFFPPATGFILEGDRRHPSQQIRRGSKDPLTQQISFVDYTVKLPPRSLNEFSLWLNRHMEYAQVLAPAALVEKHAQAARKLSDRYSGID